MGHLRGTLKLAFLLTAALILSATAQAAIIQYSATDLADTTPGEDLWRYDYTVSGHTFLQSQFFDIYFDPLLYRALAVEAAPGPEWDAIILQQPNPANLPPFDRGMFDVAAVVDNPPVPAAFSVSFVFLGPGTPASQPFDIFGISGGNAALLESGVTTPLVSAVPEPGSFFLILTGMALPAMKFYRAGRCCPTGNSRTS